MKTLVLRLGNELYGDDGVGMHAIRQLKKEFQSEKKVSSWLGLKVPKEIKIIAVEAKNMYNLGEGLSPEMKRALPSIVEKVKNILRR